MSAYLAQTEIGADLLGLIRAADAMNHAIPTNGQLSRALTRLAKIGVVSEVDGHFVIDPQWLPDIEKARSGKGGQFSLPEKGKKWLSSKKFPYVDASITITDAQVTAAFEQYRKMLRR